ncbi:MAG: hypothetical protein BWX93_01606 [Bacteroidetes bacterium ADurb.Bin139]|nr:MAG: hypothetical protein BWX93_01606 [Bacteroidetes bacterium ADurb.Bin139]
MNCFDANLIQLTHKKFPVFCFYDSLYGRPQYLHPVFFKDSLAVKLYPAIEGRLTSESQQYAIGFFLFNDLLYKKRGNRQKIYGVCHAFRRLYGSNIGVYQYSTNMFFTDCLKGLGSGIVKFTGFPDF